MEIHATKFNFNNEVTMNKIAIIPQPKKVQELGGVFALNSDATIAWNGNEAAKKKQSF